MDQDSTRADTRGKLTKKGKNDISEESVQQYLSLSIENGLLYGQEMDYCMGWKWATVQAGNGLLYGLEVYYCMGRKIIDIKKNLVHNDTIHYVFFTNDSIKNLTL